MEYEYKLVKLNDEGDHLEHEYFDSVDKYFSRGWEYVDTIQQNGWGYSAIGVVLRKPKNISL